MRRHGITRAAIVINTDVCQGPIGCDTILPRLLAASSALTVYGPDDFEKTYYGQDDPA
jgi:hypothetical protein